MGTFLKKVILKRALTVKLNAIKVLNCFENMMNNVRGFARCPSHYVCLCRCAICLMVLLSGVA